MALWAVGRGDGQDCSRWVRHDARDRRTMPRQRPPPMLTAIYRDKALRKGVEAAHLYLASSAERDDGSEGRPRHRQSAKMLLGMIAPPKTPPSAFSRAIIKAPMLLIEPSCGRRSAAEDDGNRVQYQRAVGVILAALIDAGRSGIDAEILKSCNANQRRGHDEAILAASAWRRSIAAGDARSAISE